MPKFVIERQYLVPMYQHIVVEGREPRRSLQEGRQRRYRLGYSRDGQRRRSKDHDHQRQTDPRGQVQRQHRRWRLIRRAERPQGYGLAAFLYEDEAGTGPLLEIPEQFTDDE
jgi:hypothetical protein